MEKNPSYEEFEKAVKQPEYENSEIKKADDFFKTETVKTINEKYGNSKNEEIFKSVFEHSPLAIMATNKDGIITVCNERAIKLFGARRDKLIGFSYKSIKNDSMREAIHSALGGEKTSFEGEYLTVTGNVLTQMSANFSPSFSDDASVSGIIGIFEDITARVRAENSLKELEERFRVAFHTSPDAININKMDGTYVEINEGFTDLTGYTKDDVIGKSSRDIKIWDIPEDREMLIEGLKKEGIIRNLESRFRMKDGSCKTALLSANIIMLQEIPHILSVTKDITKLRETEKAHQELQLHVSHARKLDSIGVLAGGIAHDFNNLLTSILGNIDLALANLASEDIPRILDEAKRASLRARNLTQQLLTFSKGGHPIKNVSSIRDIIEDTDGFILRGSDVKCEYSIQEDLHNVAVDSGQISQVIQNLVINAKEAMANSGRIEISCQNYNNNDAKLLTLPRGDYVRISIKDHGAGIPGSHLENIFDPYFTTKQQGSGLGLALSYSIITRHEGRIFAESTPGEGSTFTFYLPAVHEREQVEKKPNEIKKSNARYSVLVVDDDEVVRSVVKSMLDHLGHNSICVADGEEAIKKFKQAEDTGSPFDLTIMDLTMPGGMGGEEVAGKILAVNPGAKILVSSGYSNNPVMANYRNYGFSGTMAKPYQLEELEKIIGKMLDGSTNK